MPNKQEQIEIYIQEDMDVSKRCWLVAKLKEEGVTEAWFKGDDHHRLTVQYEDKHFSHLTLLDAIKLLGFHAEFISD